jgi:glycosyltransferase involved in cell wall biosynthesis
VESVLSQDVDQVRVIIIDNASTDDSVSVARDLASEDARIEVVEHPRNLGPHASFNEGIDLATADYVMVLCADDILSPGSLRRAVTIMEQHPEVAFTHGTDIHWCPKDPLPNRATADNSSWHIQSGQDFLLDRCRAPELYLAFGMVLVRTSVQKAAGYYRPALPHSDDFEMLLRLACLGSVAFTPAVLGIKRIHGENRSGEALAARWLTIARLHAAMESFFGNEGKQLRDWPRLRLLAQRSLCERAYWCGVKALVRGRRDAFSFFKLAFQLDPRVALIPPLGYLVRFNWSAMSFRNRPTG